MECRFCFETDSPPTNKLISPCACTGTSKYVHTNCLLQWRRTTTIKTHQTICQQCKSPYILPNFESIPALLVLHPSSIIAFLNGVYIISSLCGIKSWLPVSNLIFYTSTLAYLPMYLRLLLQVQDKTRYIVYWSMDRRIKPTCPLVMACSILFVVYLYSLFPYLMAVFYCYLCAGLLHTHTNILYQMNGDLL